jgi:hypothetical protein
MDSGFLILARAVHASQAPPPHKSANLTEGVVYV